MQTALDASLQEERRIAYVAFTRAKKRLNISWLSRDAQVRQKSPVYPGKEPRDPRKRPVDTCLARSPIAARRCAKRTLYTL